MDTIVDIKNVFLFSVCFHLLTTGVAWDTIFFVHVVKLHWHIFFWKIAPVNSIIDVIYL